MVSVGDWELLHGTDV